MVSSLIAPQFHQNQFWMFSEAADQGDPNNFDTPRVPEFTPTFEVTNHYHMFNIYVHYLVSNISTPTSTAQRTAPFLTRGRIQDLPSSTTLKSTRHSGNKIIHLLRRQN